MSAKVKTQMKNPPHTGILIKRQIIDALGVNVTDAANHLGVSRPNLSKLLNGRAGLTWEMAIRFEKAFDVKADHLMRMQFAYEAAQARMVAKGIKVKKFKQEAA